LEITEVDRSQSVGDLRVAAVVSLTQSLAPEYRCCGIRVNAVSPGTIRTPARDEQIAKNPETFDALKPLPRLSKRLLSSSYGPRA
jgi:NAD(P)-dependent dehydrogenase (short-subunit alcohol dehydrogenase family)